MNQRRILIGLSWALMGLGSAILWHVDWRIFLGVLLWVWGALLEHNQK